MTIQTSDSSHVGTYEITLTVAMDDWQCLQYSSSCSKYAKASVQFEVIIGDADPCLTYDYTIQSSIISQTEYTYTVGDTALIVVFDPYQVNTYDSSCIVELSIETSDGTTLDTSIFSFDAITNQLTVFNDQSDTIPSTHNLRVRASSPGKVSGDGILDFNVIIQRSCYDKEVTIDASIISDIYYSFEIGRDSELIIVYDKSAVYFDGDADACEAQAYFTVVENSSPAIEN